MTREADERTRGAQYGGLAALLKPHDVPDAAVAALHRRLSEAGAARGRERQAAASGGTESHGDETGACEVLRDAGTTIARRLGYPGDLRPFDDQLFRAYVATRNEDGTAKSPGNAARREWEEYGARLCEDAALLARVAARAGEDLRSQGAKRGRRPLTWRHDQLDWLFGEVSALVQASRSKRVALVCGIWDAYFAADGGWTNAGADRQLRRSAAEKRSGQN